MSLVEHIGYTMDYYLPIETQMSTEKVRLIEDFFWKKYKLCAHFSFALVGSYGINNKIKNYLDSSSEYEYLFRISIRDGHDDLTQALGSLEVENISRKYIEQVFGNKVVSHVLSKRPSSQGEKYWERFNGEIVNE